MFFLLQFLLSFFTVTSPNSLFCLPILYRWPWRKWMVERRNLDSCFIIYSLLFHDYLFLLDSLLLSERARNRRYFQEFINIFHFSSLDCLKRIRIKMTVYKWLLEIFPSNGLSLLEEIEEYDRDKDHERDKSSNKIRREKSFSLAFSICYLCFTRGQF